MSHYDALGVSKNATPEEIKKAFRRMAKANHPDRKGGDARAMVAINKAYECLSDPLKRAYYDAHGEEAKLDTVETQAMQIIYQILMQLCEQVESYNFVEAVTENLRVNLNGLHGNKPKIEKKIAKLERQRKCIRRKAGKENLLDRIFQQQIDALNAKIAELPQAIEIGKKALEIMADYENAFTGSSFVPTMQGFGGNAALLEQLFGRGM